MHSVSHSDDAKHLNSVVTLLDSVVLHVPLCRVWKGFYRDPEFDRYIVHDMENSQNFLPGCGIYRYSGSGYCRIHTRDGFSAWCGRPTKSRIWRYTGCHGYVMILLNCLSERSRERVRARTWRKIQDDNIGIETSNFWWDFFDFFVIFIVTDNLLIFFIPLYKPPHCRPLKKKKKKKKTCLTAYGAWVFSGKRHYLCQLCSV